ncbi:MAG TPA: bile acid:sodium symporter [Anaerolineales bacterium]|nr:bile acid:sodium symporter [Anaerolineales bacterium]
MTTALVLAQAVQVSRLVFVVTSMVTMGLSLNLAQIREPLKDLRLVILALVANLLLVPMLGYAILLLIPLESSMRDGLIVLSMASGAPFIPKLVQIAKGDIGYGVGLMVLLMTATVLYLPIVLPLFWTGIQVDSWSIAQSLIELMLLPLVVGLILHVRLPHLSDRLRPVTGWISSAAIAVLVLASVALNSSYLLDLILSGRIVALLLLYAGAFAIGIALGGSHPWVRSSMGLGTATRNVSAALVVVGQNFAGTSTLAFVVVAGVIDLLLLLSLASWFRGRTRASDLPV